MLPSRLIKFRFSKNPLPLWACLVLILCSGGYLGAQMGVATISGVVTDPGGSLVPGAKITLESATESQPRHGYQFERRICNSRDTPRDV